MRRRTFIATAGALLSAGCGALSGGGGRGGGGRKRKDWGGPVITDNDVGTLPPRVNGNSSLNIDSGVDSKVGTIDVEVGSVGTIGDISVGNDGEENQGTPTRANSKASRLIGDARNKLDAALEEYRKFAGRNSSILDVNASHTSFTKVSVVDYVNQAEDKLDAAVEPATDGQKMNILALKNVSVFIRYAARCQQALGDAYKEVTFMADRLYNESLSLVQQGNRQAEPKLSTAKDAYKIIDDEVEGEAFAAYGTLSETVYDKKARQIDAELSMLQNAAGALMNMRSGVDTLQTAVPAFLDEKYEEAERGFSGASADFGIARTAFGVTDGGSRSVRKRIAEIESVARTLDQATRDLERAAEAKTEDKRLVFYEARRAAEAHIESNEIVRNMRTLNDLIA